MQSQVGQEFCRQDNKISLLKKITSRILKYLSNVDAFLLSGSYGHS